MTTSSNENDSYTRAPLRVVQVLTALASNSDGSSLAHLSEQLAVPKTSLFSLLKSLERAGYVESANGHHRLGAEAYNLAAVINNSRPFLETLRPALTAFHSLCGETVMIALPGNQWLDLTYVDVIESDSSLRYLANIGARRPLFCTAPGLVLLAHASRNTLKRYFEVAEFRSYTPDTIVSRSGVLRLVKLAKARGFAVSTGVVEGAMGIAAPIFDRNGNIRAAVSMAGASSKLAKSIDRFTAISRNTGKEMSCLLGFSGNYPG